MSNDKNKVHSPLPWEVAPESQRGQAGSAKVHPLEPWDAAPASLRIKRRSGIRQMNIVSHADKPAMGRPLLRGSSLAKLKMRKMKDIK